MIAEKKRAQRGDPSTGKLKNKPQPLCVSGKRKQKLLKKWRRVPTFSFLVCIVLHTPWIIGFQPYIFYFAFLGT